MNRLKALRQEKGVKQKDMAELLGISRAAYTNIENGKRETDFSSLKKLASYFHVTTDYLLEISDDINIKEIKKAPSEIQMGDISYALFGEVRELTDEDKEELLRSAKRMRELQELKKQNKKSQG